MQFVVILCLCLKPKIEPQWINHLEAHPDLLEASLPLSHGPTGSPIWLAVGISDAHLASHRHHEVDRQVSNIFLSAVSEL